MLRRCNLTTLHRKISFERSLLQTFGWSTEITMSTSKPRVVFVLGAPGSGKGTQCEMLVKEFSFVHLSAGHLLRQEMSRPDSEFRDLINEYIKNGQIVPVEITIKLLEEEMNKHPDATFLIDGFPRNQNNLDGWQKHMSDKANVTNVIFIDCSEQVCSARCLQRGNSGSGRTDDNLESLQKRLHTYMMESLPIIQHYDKLNLVHHVDGSKSIEEVSDELRILFSVKS